MGYAIHGTEPTAPEGLSFHRSNWAWPRLAALCRKLVPEFAEQCKYWTGTQGAGLSADAAAKLAERLHLLIADGTIAEYMCQFHAKRARLPDEPCDACEGSGRIPRAVAKTPDQLLGWQDTNGEVICLPCLGAGRRQPLTTYRLLDENDVRDWVSFLRSSGGFCIH